MEVAITSTAKGVMLIFVGNAWCTLQLQDSAMTIFQKWKEERSTVTSLMMATGIYDGLLTQYFYLVTAFLQIINSSSLVGFSILIVPIIKPKDDLRAVLLNEGAAVAIISFTLMLIMDVITSKRIWNFIEIYFMSKSTDMMDEKKGINNITYVIP